MTIDYVKEGKLATLTINRPQVGNALNMIALQELNEAMIEFRDDPEVLVGIITGAGEKAFCTGADAKEALPILKESKDITKAFPALPMRGLDIWKPLIAAINGMALGGGLELALICDIRIASQSARFGMPEVTLGLIPGWGGTQLLPRTIPLAKAAELILIGGIMDADEAYRIGLVNKVVSPQNLMPTAKEWAESIVQNAPLAVRSAKEAMIRGGRINLGDGLKLESSLENYLLGTEDFAEGIAARKEKRKPVFKAR